MLGAGAGAVGGGHRQHAEAEGERGHHDRSEAKFGAFERGRNEVHALLDAILGKLDDEDGVLGGEAERGQQTDLEVNVVGLAHEAGGNDTADRAQGQCEKYRHWDRPTLVEGGQAEEDHEDREGVEGAGLAGCLTLLVG